MEGAFFFRLFLLYVFFSFFVGFGGFVWKRRYLGHPIAVISARAGFCGRLWPSKLSLLTNLGCFFFTMRAQSCSSSSFRKIQRLGKQIICCSYFDRIC